MKKGIALLLTAVYLLATAGTAVLSLTCGCAERKAHAPARSRPQNSGDDERHIRCTVIDLPPALAAECPCPAHVPFLRKKVAERRPPFVQEAVLLPVGFRAPPVSA